MYNSVRSTSHDHQIALIQVSGTELTLIKEVHSDAALSGAQSAISHTPRTNYDYNRNIYLYVAFAITIPKLGVIQRTQLEFNNSQTIEL